jgi:2-keto-4-pentenoate hydratase/2-oxohepta-3-ene-1,7-dioic acid hydratase in catechol pathway
MCFCTAVQQANRTPPPNPFIFFKPIPTIIGHNENVIIPKIAQDDQADYEGELVSRTPSSICPIDRLRLLQVLVIGKDAVNVPREKALEYVAAYTVGNDISSRKLQRNPELAGRIPQWGFSKGFDTYAPMGPCLVASRLVDNPRNLHLKTTIDGEVRQDETVADMLFDSEAIISYLSQGTTLQKGSVIMTGTPGGKCNSPS